MLRVGLGKDIHRLVSGRPFLLGGVELPHTSGESGHSDGDVLIHAIIDALLGAVGLGDIGELFPPGDPKWKGEKKKKLLSIAWDMVKKEGWRIVNIDCVVCCEAPKILPHRDAIRESLANILEINNAQVFVKGKTAEGLGELGRGEAVEALALCLLTANDTEKPEGICK
jgi:2-C-methyl-D-erythritol 2,4-cyclodiphosphate synthase/2-C-methyl-D-erythritol 4-phosphate cytidylyltransferase/2-C-methyl-D-erythritol 2,4-cyclodiphosphate synthase